MTRTTFAALSLAAVLTPVSAQAMDFGAIRALQHGPIGDSPQFANIGEYEGEGAVVMSRTWGKYTINDDADSKVSGSSLKTRVVAGGGWSPSKAFTLSGYLDTTLASDFDETQRRTNPHATLDTGVYRHEVSLFGTFRSSPLVLGGGLGVLIVGSETREFIYDDNKYTQDVTSAAMPMLRLYGGISTKEFDGTVGIRLFSMGEAVVTAQKPNKDKEEYDIVRRSPGEIHADGRLKLNSVSIAGSLAYVLTSQASEQIDEFSTRFEQDGNAKVRKTGNARRNDDQIKAGIGARFDPSKMIGILGGLSYIGANFAEPQYASLEHENLGGIRLDIGTEVHVQTYKGFFQAGYCMDSSSSYKVEDASRSSTNVEKTQRPPLNDGDRIKISQGSWNLALGGGVTF